MAKQIPDAIISAEKMADGAVIADKTDFMEREKRNLIDGCTFSENTGYGGNSTEGSAAESYAVKEFIPVKAGRTYYLYGVGSNEGLKNRCIYMYDANKTYLAEAVRTTQTTVTVDGVNYSYQKSAFVDGTAYIKCCFLYDAPIAAVTPFDPETFFGTSVEYGTTLDEENALPFVAAQITPKVTEKVTADIEAIVAEAVKKANPIYGKNICLIGDSNTQYSGGIFKTYFEETYGCNFTPLGYAGATWENGDGVTHEYSAVGRVNALIANASEGNICTDYDMVLIMMGTNISKLGAVTDKSTDVSTMCGAIRYCLEKLVYYYRKSKIGVILPPQRNDGNDEQLSRNDIIQQICEEYAVPTLDLNRRGQIVGDSKLGVSSFYLDDGLHFGANGQIAFKQTVGKWMAYQL